MDTKYFNDEDLCRILVYRLLNTIQWLNICMIDPSVLIYPRTAILLKSTWAGLKSEYCIAKYNFEFVGQYESESFPNYTKGSPVLMCTHAFLNRYSHFVKTLLVQYHSLVIERKLQMCIVESTVLYMPISRGRVVGIQDNQ